MAENKAQNTQKNTQKKDADRKKDARNRKRMGNQREIWLSAGCIGVLFLCLLVYLGHFVATSEQDMINNSYNSRQQILLSRNYRGSIYSRDGDVLAETILDADEEETRNYPYKNLFSHIVGYSTQGRMGVEALANYYLINTNTSLSNKVKNDTAGKKNPGDNVYTTLDVQIQQVANDQLDIYRGAIIVTEVSTGKILAMVSHPDFDPNTIPEIWDDLIDNDSSTVLLNRATQGLYPPGSTFKIITSTAALESHAVSQNDRFYCPGYKIVDDRRIRCHKISGHGSESFVEGLMNSCNPVFIETGLRTGVQVMYQYFDRLGLMEKSGIDLPGEASSIMHQIDNVGDVELATISFGQSFQITPIQMLRAVSAVINGGKLITPHFGVRIVDAEGNMIRLHYNEEAHVIGSEVSDTMKALLEKVISEGTGKKCFIEGYRIGGKTATSQKLPRGSGKYIASFIGFAPADNPEIIGIVLIDEPTGAYYGGTVAAPVMREIFENVLPYYLGQWPDIESDSGDGNE